MYIAITVIHIIACLFLIGIVLLQQGKGADMGAVFGGSSQTLFGSSGAGNFLTRLTAVAAVTFMLTSLVLAYGSARSVTSTVFDDAPLPAAPLEDAGAPLPDAGGVAPDAEPDSGADAGTAPDAPPADAGAMVDMVEEAVDQAADVVEDTADAVAAQAAEVADEAEEAAEALTEEMVDDVDPAAAGQPVPPAAVQ